MTNAIEAAWEHLKELAREYAAAGSYPSRSHAAGIVERTMRQYRVDPMPEGDALAYFTNELLLMIDADTGAKTHS